MPKEQPGEYMPLVRDDDRSEVEYVRGHVGLNVARDALNRWEVQMGDGANNVMHKWARCVPVKNQDYDIEFRLCDGPKRGAFAVTEVTFS